MCIFRYGGSVALALILVCFWGSRSAMALEIGGKKFTLMRYQDHNTYVLIKGTMADGGPFSSYDDLLSRGLIKIPSATTRFRTEYRDKESVLIEYLDSCRDIYYVDYTKDVELMDRDHQTGVLRDGCRNYVIGSRKVVDGEAENSSLRMALLRLKERVLW